MWLMKVQTTVLCTVLRKQIVFVLVYLLFGSLLDVFVCTSYVDACLRPFLGKANSRAHVFDLVVGVQASMFMKSVVHA